MVTQNETGGSLFARGHVRGDCVRLLTAIKGGWMSPENRDMMLQKAWQVAEQSLDNGEVKPFVAICNMLEKAYEFDIKLAERASKQNPTVIMTTAITTENLDEHRQQLIERIEALSTVGNDT